MKLLVSLISHPERSVEWWVKASYQQSRLVEWCGFRLKLFTTGWNGRAVPRIMDYTRGRMCQEVMTHAKA